MWLFTTFGMYSIHTSPRGKDILEVRTRRSEDLVALRVRCLKLGRTQATPKRDYQYRAQVNRAALAQAIAREVGKIDYDNFKESVQGDEDRHSAYMQVWAAVRQGLSTPVSKKRRNSRPSRLSMKCLYQRAEVKSDKETATF
jgi:hypothetical protein